MFEIILNHLNRLDFVFVYRCHVTSTREETWRNLLIVDSFVKGDWKTIVCGRLEFDNYCYTRKTKYSICTSGSE